MLNERSKQIRRDIIDLSQANFGYHYGGSFSCVEILISLFDHVLQAQDKFIMSKGHACWGYYVLLRERGYSPLLEGHPHLDESNGVNYTSGSMGHGFPAAVGMAMARKVNEKPGKIFVLIGDGECQEGTTWESTLIGGRYSLDNLIVIVDNNNIQGSGYVSDILDIKPVEAMATAAKWAVNSVDGHDINALSRSLKTQSDKPQLIIAKTIKGKGVSFMENVPAWHAKFLDPEHERIAREELL
jgi:transketolase